MRTTIAARAPGIFLFSIAYGLQKRMEAGIEAIPLIYRLKAGLRGLPQFLWRRVHSPSPSAREHVTTAFPGPSRHLAQRSSLRSLPRRHRSARTGNARIPRCHPRGLTPPRRWIHRTSRFLCPGSSSLRLITLLKQPGVIGLPSLEGNSHGKTAPRVAR